MGVLTTEQERKIDGLFYAHATGSVPLRWQSVLSCVWDKYRGSRRATAMRQRYYCGKTQTETRCDMNISLNSYFNWRMDFIVSAALEAARRGIDF